MFPGSTLTGSRQILKQFIASRRENPDIMCILGLNPNLDFIINGCVAIR